MQYKNDNLNNQLASIYRTPSKSEAKAQSLAKAKQEKLNNLSGTPDETLAERYDRIYGASGVEGPVQNDYVDQFQAGAYRLGRDTAQLGTDAAGGIARAAGYEDIANDLQSIKYRTNEEINAHVGYDPRQHNQDMESLGTDYDKFRASEGFVNSLSAGYDVVGSALNATPGLIADTGATMATMAIPGLGGTSLFAKGATMANAASNTAKALTALDKVVKVNRTTTAIGLGMANQQIRKYEEDTGEQASWQRIVGSGVANTALMGIELNILGSMAKAIPKDMAKALTIDTAMAIKNNGLKGLTKNIVANAGKIATAVSAEAGQEYLQTWTQILTEQGGDSTDIIKDPKNQREAAIAAIAGGTTAGAIRGAPIAATSTLTGTARVAGKTVETIAKKGQQAVTDRAYNTLSSEQKDELAKKYKEESDSVDKATKANTASADNISKATTIEELQSLNDDNVKSAIEDILDKDNVVKEAKKKVVEVDSVEGFKQSSPLIAGIASKLISDNKDTEYSLEELKRRVIDNLNNRYTPQDLKANIDKIKNEAIARYNGTNTKLKAALEITRAKDYGYTASKNLYSKSKELLDKTIPKEARDAIVAAAIKGKDLSKAGLDLALAEVKDLDKSTLRAMSDAVVKGRFHKGLLAFSEAELESLKKGFEGNAKAKKVIDKVIRKKKDSLVAFDKLKETKPKDFLGKLVNGAGKVVNSDFGMQVRGLVEITKDSLKDSDNLARARALVNTLKDKQEKSPDKFTTEEANRLRQAIKDIASAKKDNQQGAINNTMDLLKKKFKEYKVAGRTTEASKNINKYFKDTYKKIENSQSLKDISKATKDLDNWLGGIGENPTGVAEVAAKEAEKETITEEKVKESKSVDYSTITIDSFDTAVDKAGSIEEYARSFSDSEFADLKTNPDEDIQLEIPGMEATRSSMEEYLPPADAAVSTAPDKAVDGTMSDKMKDIAKEVCGKG